MSGLICYYSGSGNTQLACEVMASRLGGFELFDITRGGTPELSGVTLVGLATWADFLNPPATMKTFLENLPLQSRTPAFVFNTYGGLSGRTLTTLHQWARHRGFHVIAGHSLHTPENFPPMIKRGQNFRDSPNPKELAAFEAFVLNLRTLFLSLGEGKIAPERKIGWARLLPSISRTHSRKVMGEKLVDAAACTSCGVCRDHCPYEAITLAPQPVFDQSKCRGCWACYHHCPAQAIYTRKISNVPQYAHPNDQLVSKLRGLSSGGQL